MKDEAPKITATPFKWLDPATIPPRDGLSAHYAEIGGVPMRLGPSLAGKCDETGIAFDDENGYVDIYWGNYQYSIAYGRINTPAKLIPWLNHLAEKWETVNAQRLLALLDLCSIKFGWNKWG